MSARANPVEVSFLRVLMASGTPMRAKTMQAREKEARLGQFRGDFRGLLFIQIAGRVRDFPDFPVGEAVGLDAPGAGFVPG